MFALRSGQRRRPLYLWREQQCRERLTCILLFVSQLVAQDRSCRSVTHAHRDVVLVHPQLPWQIHEGIFQYQSDLRGT